jgi:hypothetical protein
MTFKNKVIGALVGCTLLLVISLSSYCKGKKVGETENEVAHVEREIGKLEHEKEAVNAEARAGDTIALRHRILKLANDLGRKRS